MKRNIISSIMFVGLLLAVVFVSYHVGYHRGYYYGYEYGTFNTVDYYKATGKFPSIIWRQLNRNKNNISHDEMLKSIEIEKIIGVREQEQFEKKHGVAK